MTSRCPLCPVDDAIECRGLKVRRFCDLVNPAHAAYVPGYEVSVRVASSPVPADRPSPAAAVALVHQMKSCPFRSVDPGCGCSGARCALRRGGIVSHVDCFACLKAYPD